MTTATTAPDEILPRLADGLVNWLSLPLTQRAGFIRAVATAMLDQSERWVAAAAAAKALPAGSPLMGEEWLSGPYAITTSALGLASSLERLASGESTVRDSQLTVRNDGRVIVDVFPRTWWETLLLHGFHAEVWAMPGVDREDVLNTAGLAQRFPSEAGGIGVVLGAGNVTSIGVLDTLYEVVAHNRAVVLKLNPVLSGLLDVTRAVLAPLMAIGLVEVVTGGVEVGQQLLHDERVAHVHITGSQASHDTIVFGPGEEGQERRQRGEVLLDKPISSELGGVSPTIVVPNGWSRRDIEFQARQVATQRLHNGGYNCIATQVVVIPKEWKQREVFVDALRRAMAQAPARKAYYPGSDSRVSSARVDHPAHEDMGNGRVLVVLDETAGPDTDGAEPPIFTTEYFSPVLALVTLPGKDHDYLTNAATFANTRLAGTLGANVLVHPRYMKRLQGTWTKFVDSLHYGTIAVNTWVALGYLTAGAPWGAYPGNSLKNAASGIGVVHNALLLADTERTVVTGPFRPLPRSLATGQITLSPSPPWMVDTRQGAQTSRLLVRFLRDRSVLRLPRLLASAMRG